MAVPGLNINKEPEKKIEWFVTPSTNDLFVLAKDSLMYRGQGPLFSGLPALITDTEVFTTKGLEKYNMSIEEFIQSARETLKQENPDVKFIEVPVIFTGDETYRAAYAFTPNLANMQSVDKLYFPKPYVPLDEKGNDIFESYLKEKLKDIVFVIDWNFYHRFKGEVHCGTLTQRAMYDFEWWKKIQ